MDGKHTSKYGPYMRQVITQARVVITQIYVEIHWELLDGRKSKNIFQSTPYLKYIIIQLRLRQNFNYSNPSRCWYVGIYGGRGYVQVWVYACCVAVAFVSRTHCTTLASLCIANMTPAQCRCLRGREELQHDRPFVRSETNKQKRFTFWSKIANAGFL